MSERSSGIGEIPIVGDVKDNFVDEMTTGDKRKVEMPSLALAVGGNPTLG